MGVTSSVKGRDAVVVEDVVDTGLTTTYAARYLRRKGASSVRVCTLLDKPSRRQSAAVTPDYVGFTVPNQFVVGYGLDFDEQYRHLPDIYVLTGGDHGP
jgi:hypoxanthine phosphoribosyltransferase